MPFTPLDATLGRLLLQHRAVNPPDLDALIRSNAQSNVPLAQLVVRYGLLTEAALAPFLEMARANQAGRNPSSGGMPAVPPPTGAPSSEQSAGTYMVRPRPGVSPAQPARPAPTAPPPAPAARMVGGAPLPAPFAATQAAFAPPPPTAPGPATLEPPPGFSMGAPAPAPLAAPRSMGGISVLPSIPLPPQPPLAPPEEVPSLELVPLAPAAPLVAPTANASARDEMDNLLRAAAGMHASDLHLHSGMPIMVRLRGLLTPQPTQPFPAQHVEALVRAILTPVQQARLDDAGELDFAYGISGVGRFRANVYRHQRGMDATFRIIPDQVPTMEQLGLPPALQALTKYHNGMVLFTGPAGCGKSTSLASLLNVINQHHHGHILTIEDPIEYVHRPIKCSVNQRQVGPHTESFARALKGALREDPDVIVIGEMRDLETISLALSAAETGHLVLATLHTSNAIRTVNRIINAFPPSQQDQVRAMLSESLRGVVSQRLVRTVDGSRRLAALEVMMVSKAVGNLIRENKTLQIRSILQTGSADGNYLLDNSLLHLFQQKIISKEEALLYAEEPKRFG